MPSSHAISSSDPPSARGTRRRRLLAWWRSLSPKRQDRLATLAPLASVLLFLAAMVFAFWYLRNEELDLRAETVRRDTDLVQQQLRLRLLDTQDQLGQLAREVLVQGTDPSAFTPLAGAFAAARPEVLRVTWLGLRQEPRWMFDGRSGFGTPSPWPEAIWEDAPMAPAVRSPSHEADASSWAFIAARDLRMPTWSRAYRDGGGTLVFQLQMPLVQGGRFVGTLAADIGIDALVRRQMPPDVTRRHIVSIVDDHGTILASTAPSANWARLPTSGPLVHDAPLTPALNGLSLVVAGWRDSLSLVSNALFWMVVALSALTVWMLIGTWRHVRRRFQIQQRLQEETNFRRAMENSVLTGMRAIDLDGRITYVNPAFCEMTGFSEQELVGQLPPYPYWPVQRLDENRQLVELQLAGRIPPAGIEARFGHKDGTEFDARMYVSPLVDARGQQTGWMSSITNITDAKRVRDQLAAAHERFTTVLEGLDAAVSVVSVQQGDLLFANRSYRIWFGADGRGHAQLAEHPGGTPLPPPHGDEDGFGGLPMGELDGVGGAPREVWVPQLEKWFDVRSRYLQWTDGSLAQMLIATDVTVRRQAEELAQQQAERAQVSSRLITMGEMASQVAHELNQPLTAIANYCSGMKSRLANDRIDRDGLTAALDKTARQAERAGQIIHRIRSFVRKTGPQRVPARAEAIVEDALELASFEVRRRGVQVRHYVAHHLPDLHCDPILIEQVLVNLVKNAAEAIDLGKMPPTRRHIELSVLPRHVPDQGGVIEFSVTDQGPGLAQEVLDRLYEAFHSTKPEGMGIGLSLCRSIVESHQGRIEAVNLYNDGQVSGCRFAFTLPIESVAQRPPRPNPAEPAAESTLVP